MAWHGRSRIGIGSSVSFFFFLDTRDSVSGHTCRTGTGKSTICVFTGSLRMAVVKNLSLFIFEALVFVLTFFGCPVVPETLARTATFSVNTFCWSVACFSTSLSSTTSEPVAYPWVLSRD